MSGQWVEMPEDRLTAKVSQPNGRSANYTRMRVRDEDHKETEVWGWSPLCYRKVKTQYLRMMEP